MLSNAMTTYPLRLTLDDYHSARDVLRQYFQKNGPAGKNYDVALQVIYFFKTIKPHLDKSTRYLTFEENLQLAALLVQGNLSDLTSGKIPIPEDAFLISLINAFGGQKLLDFKDQLKKEKTLTPEFFRRHYHPTTDDDFLPMAPRQVSADRLNDDGTLIVAHRKEIIKLIKRRVKKEPAGRVTKKEILEMFGSEEKETTYSAEYFVNEKGGIEIYWVFLGMKLPYKDAAGWDISSGSLIGSGSFSRVKILQKEVDTYQAARMGNKIWQALKIKPIHSSRQHDDAEFKKTQREGLGKGRIVRVSPSRKKWQEEIVMEWLPGEPLRNYLPLKRVKKPIFPLVHWLEICLNMVDVLIRFHKKVGLHRDIKPENLFVLGTTIRVIDCGETVSLPEGKTEMVDELKGTPGYVFPTDIKNVATYIYSVALTEMYALGIVFAEALGLIDYPKKRLLSALMREGFQFITPMSTEFLEHKLIPDKEDRLDMLDFVCGMTRKPSSYAPRTLEECDTFFKKYYQKAKAETQLAVCLININEFMDLSQQLQEGMLKKIREGNFYSIEFVERDDKKHTRKQYILARRQIDDAMVVKVDAKAEEGDVNHVTLLGTKPIKMAGKKFEDFGVELKQHVEKSFSGKRIVFTFLTFEPLKSSEAKVCGELGVKMVSMKNPTVGLAGFNGLMWSTGKVEYESFGKSSPASPKRTAGAR